MAKWIILAIIAFLLIALVSVIVVTVWVQAEAPFRKEKLVRSGRASALILYHPSRDAHFSDDVTMALARGFEEDGFSVERWTITRQTPARPMGFNVIAVVSNTFFWAPDWPTQRYLERADLGDQQVLAILGGGGNTHRAQLVGADAGYWKNRRAFGGNQRLVDLATERARCEAGRQPRDGDADCTAACARCRQEGVDGAPFWRFKPCGFVS